MKQKRSCKDRRALHRDSRRASPQFIKDFGRHLKRWNVEWKELSRDEKASYKPMCPARPISSLGGAALKRTNNCYMYFVREKIEEGILSEVKVEQRSSICYSAPSRPCHRRGAQVHGAHQAASHTPALYLPSRSRYSFTDPERMEPRPRVQRATGPRLPRDRP